MKRFGTRSHIIVITLIVYLLSFSGIAGRADILCFGEDGHVSIDSVGAILALAGIHFENDHDAVSGQNPDHCEEDCRTCLDVPLSSMTFQRLVVSANEINLAFTRFPSGLSTWPPIFSPRLSDPNLTHSPIQGNTSVSSLCTVVLLI